MKNKEILLYYMKKIILITLILLPILSGCQLLPLDPRNNQTINISFDLKNQTSSFKYDGPKPFWVEERIKTNVEKTSDTLNMSFDINTKSKNSATLWQNIASFITGIFTSKFVGV
jgi:hypothetical protein